MLFSKNDLKIIDTNALRLSFVGESLSCLFFVQYYEESVSFIAFDKISKTFNILEEDINYDDSFLISGGSFVMGQDYCVWTYVNNNITYLCEVKENQITINELSSDAMSGMAILNVESGYWYKGYNNNTTPYIFSPQVLKVVEGKIINSENLSDLIENCELENCFVTNNKTIIILHCGADILVYQFCEDKLDLIKTLENYDIKSSSIINSKLILFDGKSINQFDIN